MRAALPAASASMLLALALLSTLPAAAAGFIDPLDMPAPPSVHLTDRPLRALALAGERLLAVGERGRIILSDDAGKSWRQAKVPISSDLNAVDFASPQLGWVAGHDGTILHTQDGGESWTLRLDGRRIHSLVVDHYRRRLQAGHADTVRLLEEIGTLMQPGPSSFFMDIAFESAKDGIAVGKFGLILGTRDGGLTWVPLLEQVPNPDYLHLSAVRHIAGRTWIVGERGQAWVRDAGQSVFRLVPVGYEGGLFGIIGDAHFVLAYGMRGNAFRSTDGGRHWSRVETGVASGLSHGMVRPGGQVVLTTLAGQLLASRDAGRSFKPFVASAPTMFTAVIGLSCGPLVLAGLNGVRLQSTTD